MQIIKEKISLDELKQMSQKTFDNLVKAVVDVEQGIMAVDADIHADEEKMLLEDGSKQENLWGINLFYPELEGDDFIEFDSMINLRPWQNNRSRGVEDKGIRATITKIVDNLIQDGTA